MEIIWPVPADEVVPWTAAMMTTFLGDPVESRVRAEYRSRHWRPDRAWGVKDRGRWVATLRTIGTTLSVPGGASIPADALTNVTVAATHRRQGILSGLLAQSLDAARHRGDAVSALLAAEWPIYGRFGYAPATLAADYLLLPRRRGARLREPGPGLVRQVEAEELRELAPRVFAAARLDRAGNIDRDDAHWDARLAVNGYPEPLKPPAVFVVHDGPEGVDGYLGWTPTGGDWDDTHEGGEITVGDFMTSGDDAYRGLCHYLLSIDTVEKIHLHQRPSDEALGWLMVDGRALQQQYRGDHLWLRLLDVRAALAGRTYAHGGRLVLEVLDDDLGGYAAGRYLLDAGPDAICVTSTEPADLTVHQRALASAYLGAVSLTRQRIAGLVQEHRAGALALADSMFATAIDPWLATSF